MTVSRSELTVGEAAQWLGANRAVNGTELTDPDGTVIGFMIRGTGWRLLQTGDGPLTLLKGELPQC